MIKAMNNLGIINRTDSKVGLSLSNTKFTLVYSLKSNSQWTTFQSGPNSDPAIQKNTCSYVKISTVHKYTIYQAYIGRHIWAEQQQSASKHSDKCLGYMSTRHLYVVCSPVFLRLFLGAPISKTKKTKNQSLRFHKICIYQTHNV